jgi:hypothetical protein
MLINHQDNSQCSRFRVCSGRDALRGLHRDHCPSCSSGDAALSEALAALAMDFEAVFQIFQGCSLSRFSTRTPVPIIVSMSLVRRNGNLKTHRDQGFVDRCSTARTGEELCFGTLRCTYSNMVGTMIHSQQVLYKTFPWLRSTP